MAESSVEIYTDGACSGNPGPGGWGAVLRYGDVEKEIYGGDAGPTTNNRMELMAPIEALESLKRRVTVNLYTDSTYVRNGITSWVRNWKNNGWMTSAKTPSRTPICGVASTKPLHSTTSNGIGSRATPDIRRTSERTGSPSKAWKRSWDDPWSSPASGPLGVVSS